MYVKVHQTDGKPRWIREDGILSFAGTLGADNGKTAIQLISGHEIRIMETPEWLAHTLKCVVSS